MSSFASLASVLCISFSVFFATFAMANPCLKSFGEIAASQERPSVYALSLRHLSPGDELRIRKLIESLEAKGVSRETILRELNQGSVCGI